MPFGVWWTIFSSFRRSTAAGVTGSTKSEWNSWATSSIKMADLWKRPRYGGCPWPLVPQQRSSRDWSPYYICPPQDSWNRTRFEHITSSEKHAQKVIRSSSRISLVNLHCARRNKGLQRGLVMRSIPATMTRLYDLGVALWNFLLNYDTVWYVLPMLCY